MPIRKEILQKYKSDAKIMIETGCHVGNGIKEGLKAGFNRVFSIELSDYFYNYCREKFKHEKTITLIFGNSAEQLPLLLLEIKSKCLFWLDGHYSGGNTAGENIPSPLYSELAAIREHEIKNHIILIDDIRSEDVNKLKEAVLKINPKYTFYTEDSIVDDKLTFKDDVLIAVVEG